VTPVVRDKASALKAIVLSLLEGGDVPDVTINQTLIATKHPASKGDINQIAYVPIQINKSVAAAIRLIDDIIEYNKPVEFEEEQTIDGMIQDLCALAYDSGRTWGWLRQKVTKGLVLEAERHHKQTTGAAGSIGMDRAIFRKYLT